MATGDVQDVVARIRAVLPPWFPANAPLINGAVTGFATSAAFVYSFIQFLRAQSRIVTASGGFLDLIAFDFFGTNFLRRKAEPDATYQARILKEILRPRVTVAAIRQMLIDLTGRVPSIIEPGNPGNIGAWDIGFFAFDTFGCWINSGVNNQLFITAFRPIGNGVPLVSGFDSYGGAWDVPNFSFVDLSQLTGPLSDAEIRAQILRTVAAGIDVQITIAG